MNLMKLLMLLRRNPDIAARFSVNRQIMKPLAVMIPIDDLRPITLPTVPVYVPYLVRLNSSTVADIAMELFMQGQLTKEELAEYRDPSLFRVRGFITRLVNDPNSVFYTPLVIVRKRGNKATLDVLLITTNIDKPIVINMAGET
mgnify:FL=1